MLLRNRGLLAMLLIGLMAATAGFWIWHGASSKPDAASPLVLMSSIDLQWGEAGLDEVARGEGGPDPLFERLSRDRTLVAVDNVAQLQASRAKVAMLVQPRPFAPEDLVRLDQWVRAGGRLLFFADPALQWPSDLPIGDPARPLFTSMHSPLFKHWGVELTLPMEDEATTAEADVPVGKQEITTLSAGQWRSLDTGTGRCRIANILLIAECRPGKGQVILVADADLLHASLWQSALSGADSSANMDWLDHVLTRLAEGIRVVGQGGEILDNAGDENGP